MDEVKEEHVSKAEFDAFAEEVKATQMEVKAMLLEMRKTVKEEREVEVKFYRCHKGECDFVTDDLGEFVDHIVDMHVKGVGEEKTKPFHPTIKDYLECPQCYPKFRDALMQDPRFLEELKADGWVKEEEKKPEKKYLLH